MLVIIVETGIAQWMNQHGAQYLRFVTLFADICQVLKLYDRAIEKVGRGSYKLTPGRTRL
jgi:hypothetical protein